MNNIVSSNLYQLDGIDCVTWMWKSNNDPFDSQQSDEWNAYPPAISASIEQAYSCHISKISINKNYIIDLNKMLQVNTDDTHRQRPVKRCILSKLDNNNIDWRRERFAFKLNKQITDDGNQNISKDDVTYHGSKFIADWLLTFTDGKLKVRFDEIYPVLIYGIQFEGYLNDAPEETIEWLIDTLEKVKNVVRKKPEFKRIKYLSKCCAKLYTKDCFLFRLINATLRDDDRTKLNTLGPYCYLVYNYIGRRTYDYLSVRYYLRQQFYPIQTSSIFVYRGDSVTKELLDEYRQAIGQRQKYFRWHSFVSTSYKQHVGEFFARNVLYIIELKRAMSNDQFTDLSGNTYMPDEEEVLLRPGVRFRVEKLTFDPEKRLQNVQIKIVPSYISNLR